MRWLKTGVMNWVEDNEETIVIAVRYVDKIMPAAIYFFIIVGIVCLFLGFWKAWFWIIAGICFALFCIIILLFALML